MSVSHTDNLQFGKTCIFILSLSLSLSWLGQNHKAHPLPALSLGRLCTCSLVGPLGFLPSAKTPEAQSIMFITTPCEHMKKFVIFHNKFPRCAWFVTFPKSPLYKSQQLKQTKIKPPNWWQSLVARGKKREFGRGKEECQIFS